MALNAGRGRRGRTWVLVALLVAGASTVPAQDDTTPEPRAEAELLGALGMVAERAAELRAQPIRIPAAERADAATREAADASRANSIVSASRLEARGRAWIDIGLGSADDPGRLYRRLARDVDGVAIDVSAGAVLVDPAILTSDDFLLNGKDDRGATVLLATGVRPDEPLVAHAAIHLHQIERDGDPLSPTTDETLARSALAEGESNVVAIRMLFAAMGLETEVLRHDLSPRDVLDGRLVPLQSARTGPVLREMLRFVYEEGFATIAEAYVAGGWAVVDRVLAERATTRDVIHLDRAPTGLQDPPPPGYTPPDGYEQADLDVVGEQGIVALVSIGTGKDNLGLMAGDGWNGDGLYRYERPGEPDAGITSWATRWSSPEAAADFEYGMARAMSARFGADAVQSDDDGGRSIVADGRRYELARTGRNVRFLAAPAE